MKTKKQIIMYSCKQNGTLLINFKVFGLLVILAVVLSTGLKVYPQTSWEKYDGNPILDLGPSGSWDSESIEGCSVLYLDTIYHMWYAGFDGANFRIGHATSQDGINWTKDILNPVLDVGSSGSWDNIYLYSPCVLYQGTDFHMWFAGNNGSIERIGHAISSDGSIWIKDSLNPVLELGEPGSWEDTEVFPMPGSVIFDGDLYQMWYGGLEGSTGIYATGHATSYDGSVWTKDTLNPIMEASLPGSFDSYTVVPGSILFDGNSYQQWYSGSGGDYRYRIGHAESTDGIDWIKDTVNNPVMDYGPSGSWDFMQAWCGSVLFDSVEQIYKMWYTGGDFFSGQIGYATSLITEVDDNTTYYFPRKFGLVQNYPNPFSYSTTFKFELKKPTNIQINIYNHYGELIEVIEKSKMQGFQKVEWTPGNLPAGIYYYHIQTGKEFISGKMMFIK